MQNCPVCQDVVTSLGAIHPDGESSGGGIVLNINGETYTVHVACLEAFERLMSAGQLAPA